jgi:hypothetical protein
LLIISGNLLIKESSNIGEAVSQKTITANQACRNIVASSGTKGEDGIPTYRA